MVPNVHSPSFRLRLVRATLLMPGRSWWRLCPSVALIAACLSALPHAGGAQIRSYRDIHDFGGTVTNANGLSGADGRLPWAPVTFDSAGNMYGTTIYGGPNRDSYGNAAGMLWEVTKSGVYKDIHDFGGTVTNANGRSGPDGVVSSAAVTFDSAGNMYGTTEGGGQYNRGIAWEFTRAGVYIDLHNFGGEVTNANGLSGPDGNDPQGAVTFDSAGNLCGTTAAGGPNTDTDRNTFGMIWEITSAGVYKDLHDFGGQVRNPIGLNLQDGTTPRAGVTFDSAGNMYGITWAGGPGSTTLEGGGSGVVWELPKSGPYNIVHVFGGTVTNASGLPGQDGSAPYAAVTFDTAGNMYGTAEAGGPNDTGESGGIVWEITKSGAYQDLHDFGGTVTNANGISGPDGAAPFGGVTLDAAGNLYGTATWLGLYGQPGGYGAGGNVWEITKSGVYQDLHDFGAMAMNSSDVSGPDGGNSLAAVTFDSAGNMYGTAEFGGAFPSDGLYTPGILWQITADQLVFQNQSLGQAVSSSVVGFQRTASVVVAHGVTSGWRIAGTPDLIGSGTAGLLWQNQSTGEVDYWLMDGTTAAQKMVIATGVGAAWRVVDTPDLNHYGQADLVWQNTSTGEVVYWVMSGTQHADSGVMAQGMALGWQLVATPDLNGDGQPDLLWYNATTGDLVYWLMYGRNHVGGGLLASGVSPNFVPVGAASLVDGDEPQILWMDTATGDLIYWRLTNLKVSSSGYIARSLAPGWRVVGAR